MRYFPLPGFSLWADFGRAYVKLTLNPGSTLLIFKSSGRSDLDLCLLTCSHGGCTLHRDKHTPAPSSRVLYIHMIICIHILDHITYVCNIYIHIGYNIYIYI